MDGIDPAVEAAPPDLSRLRVAIVHEWLDTFAGSERVVEQMLLCFPQSDLFTVVDFMADGERAFLGGRRVTTSFIQRLPFARRRFRAYLGLMPLAVEQFDLGGYDLVISSSHAVAKGVITGPDQVHVSYVHSPMRYAWDLQHQYLRQAQLTRGLKGMYARWLLHRLRMWDTRTANGVDHFVANSNYIRRRIRKAYRRDAEVVYPPVDVERFALSEAPRDAYVVISRQVPYKRIDLIAAAFALMPQRRLIIAGEGPEHARVVQAAAGAANITLQPALASAELIRLMQSARAFVVAAEEDFGISMVEAQACGTPLIAFAGGGARDIVTDATGVLFDTQTPHAIVDAVERFEALRTPHSAASCRDNARRFDAAMFRRRFADLVARAMLTADVPGPVAPTGGAPTG